MIKTNNIQTALNEVKNKKNSIIEAQNSQFDRKILEKTKEITLVSPEKNTKKTSIKEIDSGLNHVLTSIANKRNNKIGINLKEIKNLNKKEKALRLEKIIQNIRLCRKKDVKLAVNLEKEYPSVLISLGASTNQVKNVITQSF